MSKSERGFFLLYHYKVATTYDVLAISFGIGRATAHNTITLLNPILKKVLEDDKVLPKRMFSNTKDFESYFLNVPGILIDATESPTSYMYLIKLYVFMKQ
ncbi:MAG: transposase family protein [Runella zeae]